MTDKGDILIVEDTLASLKLLTDILTRDGYHVRPADSGALALSSIAVKLPDLILLDIRMPGMDGFEVFRKIKAREDSRDIPVIFITAITETDKRVEGLKLGAVDFISKPFQSEELLARIQTHVELRHLRVRLEQQAIELQQSEQNYRTLADSGRALVWMAGTDKLCNYFNRVWLEFTGRSIEQEMGNGWAEGVHPDDLQRCLDIYVGSFDRREAFSMEYRLRRHDGTYRWLLDDGSPRYNSKGEFIGYIGHCLDVTEQKQAEEGFRKLSRAVEQSPASIVITDTKGAIEYVNPKFVQLTGYSLEEVIGKNPRVLKSGETPSKEYAQLWNNITTGSEWHGEFHNKKKNGELYWESAVISPVTDAQGVITHFLAVKEDVTERKQSEQALQETAKEHENLIRELQYAFENVKTLQGLIPICANCKKIRDDKGFWNQVEGYISKHTDAKFSHGICPDCSKKLYGDLHEKAIEKQNKKNV